MASQSVSSVTTMTVSSSVQQVDVNIKMPFPLPDPLPAPPTLLASQAQTDSKDKVPAEYVKPAYKMSMGRWEFLRSMPTYKGPVICSAVTNGVRLGHDDLRLFVARAAFREHGIGRHDAVAILMPNGPELAVAVLCCIAWAVAVPLDPSMKADDMEAAFRQLKVAHVLTLRRHKVYDHHIESSCKAVGAKLHQLITDAKQAGTYMWAENGSGDTQPNEENSFDDTALLLRTSGTTSKPKIVPLTLRGLLTGASCIAAGLGLAQNDICLNVMPLTHIGGISCSLLSTLVSGGCVICAPGFDPRAFFGYLTDLRPSWYYAVPTIHRAVRLACPASGPPAHALRLIRSGADALLHEDAKALSSLFGCPVIPTYSMSECMPVCQPPQGYDLSKPGSVGVPIGCSLRIASPDGRVLPHGEDGEVCVSGDVITKGYVENPEANLESFFDDGGKRWFRTGDMGRMDEAGYVFLTGRAKEMIKRGGEQICPYEIEEVFSRHPGVQIALAFPVPNTFWGEEVAVAIVLRNGVEISSSSPNSAFAKTMSKISSYKRASLVQAQDSTNNSSGNRTSINSASGSSADGSLTLDRQMSHRASHQSTQMTALSSTLSSTRPRKASMTVPDGNVVNVESLLTFAARSLAPHKVPRQVRFTAEEELPKTGTGKYKRRGLCEHLGVEALDFKDEALLLELLTVAEIVPPPVKPSTAIYGIRFFVSLWVVFNHVGSFPAPIHAWRNVSITMPTFFILAGFLLESSTTRAITDRKRFFRNRWVASHPVYLMAMLFAYPAYILSNTSSIGIGMSVAVGTVFLCLSPYCLGLGLIGPAWFMNIYYACVALFPYINKALNDSRIFNLLSNPTAPCCSCLNFLCGIKCISYVAYPIVAWITFFTAFNAAIFALLIAFIGFAVAFQLGYFFGLPLWLGVFVCGMLTFRVFEHHHRGAAATEQAWRHWGKVTDGLSLFFVGVLVSQSCLAEGAVDWMSLESDVKAVGVGGCSSYVTCSYSPCNDPSWDDYSCYNESCYRGKADAVCAEVPNGFHLTDGAICLNGMRSLECNGGGASMFIDHQKVPANIVVGMLFSRPFRLATPIACLYIYGLAVGRGITARVLGSNFMVKWMAPAAYPLYLFHFPLAQYWVLLRDGLNIETKVLDKAGMVLIPMAWWEFLLFVPLVTALALFVAHVLNARATTLFMNNFDTLYSCCSCVCGLQGSLADAGAQNALFTIVDVVSGLTGADVDGTTPITQLGLDSFGASALIGILRSRVPDVPIKVADVYALETVGDIAALIERTRGEHNKNIVGSPVLSEV